MPDRRLHPLPWVLASVLIALGCGGSDPATEPSAGGASAGGDSSGAGSTPSARFDPESLCAEIIALQCRGHMSCCEREDDKYASAEECASLLEPLCIQDLSGRAYATGVIGFDSDAYDGALERLRAAVETCEPVSREVFSDVFAGTVSSDGDCTPAVEQSDYSSLLSCADGLACVVREGSEQRVCVPSAAEGEPCLDVDCADGLFCGAGNEPVCRPLRAEGIGCTAHAECETGFCGESQRCSPLTVAYRYCEDLTYP